MMLNHKFFVVRVQKKNENRILDNNLSLEDYESNHVHYSNANALKYIFFF